MLYNELGLRPEDLTEERLKQIPPERWSEAVMDTFLRTPDGHSKEGIEFGFANEAVNVLRRKYGTQMQEDEYRKIGEICNKAILYANFSRAIPLIAHSVLTMPDGTPLASVALGLSDYRTCLNRNSNQSSK